MQSTSVVTFGDRLRDQLEKRGSGGTQAWLAERSGIDRSLLSRIISNERAPTFETLRALAPVLEVDISELVAGTDAESRLSHGGDHVRRSDYEEAVGKVIEYEGVIRELRTSDRTLRDELRRERDARQLAATEARNWKTKLEDGEAEVLELRAKLASRSAELDRYRNGLQRAVAQFSALKTQVDELKAELGKTRASSRVSAAFAAVAAATSVATLAHFMGDDRAEQKKASRPKGKKG